MTDRSKARRPARSRKGASTPLVPFPQHPGKHRFPPIVTARAFHRYAARRAGAPPTPSPRRIVLVFGRRWQRYLIRRYGAPLDTGPAIHRAGPAVGIAALEGPGAPYAAIVVEELAALGTTDFVIVGLAGSLAPGLRAGSVVVCTKALRDEGTSYHYLPPRSFAVPSRTLTAQLRAGLRRAHLPFTAGPTWTTDAVYRETLPEVRRYRAAGLRTVEMEAAAVFSVARVLRRRAAALFVISDHLDDTGWEPRFHDSWEALTRLLDVTVRTLARGTVRGPGGPSNALTAAHRSARATGAAVSASPSGSARWSRPPPGPCRSPGATASSSPKPSDPSVRAG